MGLATFMAAVAYERRRARHKERQRLEEQAERQRRRAPEPGPETELFVDAAEGLQPSGGDVVLLCAVPILVLAILAVTVNAWIFWIGMVVLCGAVGAAVAMAEL